MSRKHSGIQGILLVLVAVAVTAVITRQVVSQEKTNGDKPAAQPPAPEPTAQDKAIMEACMKAATPGSNHASLKPMAGEWEITGRSWQKPGAEAQDWTSTCTTEWILGDRYLLTKCKGAPFGEGMPPFEGLGIMGYDNAGGQFESVWIDNMGTAIGLSKGQSKNEGKEFHLEGSYVCPMKKTNKAFRTMYQVVDADHFMMEMHNTGPEGFMYRCMELKYSRKK